MFQKSLAALVGGLILATTADAAPSSMEFLGDRAEMASAPGARRLNRYPDSLDTPCLSAPNLTCERRWFGWAARPDSRTTWDAIRAPEVRAQDLAAVCRVQDQSLAGCTIRTLDGAEPSPAAMTAARRLLAAFKTTERDFSRNPTEGAEILVPFRWAALLTALQVGAGPQPVLTGKIASTGKPWSRRGREGGYMPERAGRLGVQGVAVLDCMAAPDGALSDCRGATSYPNQFGFDESMMRMVAAGVLKVDPGPGGRAWVRSVYAP